MSKEDPETTTKSGELAQLGPRSGRLPKWLLLLFWSAGLLGLAYAIFTRTIGDFLLPLGIAYVVGVLITVPESGLHYRGGHAKALRERPIRYFLMFPMGGLVFGLFAAAPVFALFGLWTAAIDFFGWVRHQSTAIVVLVTAVAGGVFFWARLRFRVVYGISEAAAGLGIAFYQASRSATTGLPSDSQFYIAILTAGIYLVVRGLDNVHQGWRANSDPLAKAILMMGRRGQ